jgi:hypothetical protein
LKMGRTKSPPIDRGDIMFFYKCNNRLFYRILIALIAVMLSTASAYGQAPALDGAIKRVEPTKVLRPVPRSISIPDIFDQTNLVETPRLEVQKLLDEDAAKTRLGPLRIGVIQEFPPITATQGDWVEMEDGGILWVAWFRAPGAISIRLRLRPWAPIPGGELIVYDAKDLTQVYGPSMHNTRRKSEEFWTPPIFSNEIRLEYYLPASMKQRSDEALLAVDGLLNQYRPMPGTASTGDTLPVELSCHLDVSCYAAWANEADSVGALTYASSPAHGGFFCSSAMLNRVPQDWTPFLATARHCGGLDGWDQQEAESVFVFWFYQTPSCNGTPPNPATLPHTSGAILLVDDSNTDYTLLGLESSLSVPLDVLYAGWDAGYWSDNSAATGIHHPDGTHKRITFGTKTDDVTSCIPAQAWLIENPNGSGEIEPGSSGSPIFDSAHRVRGTASCADWSCTSDNVAEYGRFDLAFPLLEPYLYRNDASEWDVYVNGSYTGTEQGTVTQPFNTVEEGVFAVRAGTAYTLYIEAGSYDEQMVIDKAMTLRSRNGVVTIGQ